MDDHDLIRCFYCNEEFPEEDMSDTFAEPACIGYAEATADLGIGDF